MDEPHSYGLQNFLSLLRADDELFRIAQDDEQRANEETQDILHSLELDKHTYHEKAKLAIKLEDVRQRRRTAKETQETLSPIVEWALQNRPIIKGLEKVLGEMRKAESRQEHRMYSPRTDVLEEDHGPE